MVKFMQHYEIHCFYCPLYAGLDVDKDHILEMACLITDGDMNIVAEVGIITLLQAHPTEQYVSDVLLMSLPLPFECSP